MWWVYLLGVILAVAAGRETYERIGYFWHITDIHYYAHLNIHGDSRKGCWRPEHEGANSGSRAQRRPMGRYGDYSCDAPWELIDSAARTMMSRHNDNIEFVLWTGDALSHAARRLPENRQLELLQNLTDLLGKTFNSQFVFPALGHEDPSSRKELGKMWKRWLPPDSMSTFEAESYTKANDKMVRLEYESSVSRDEKSDDENDVRTRIRNTNKRLAGYVLNANIVSDEEQDIPKVPKLPMKGLYQKGNVAPNDSKTRGNIKTKFVKSTPLSSCTITHTSPVPRHKHQQEVNYLDLESMEVGTKNSENNHENCCRKYEGGYYMIERKMLKLQIVVLNTNLMKRSDTDEDAKRQWEWLNTVLQKFQKNGETVYLVGHMPPGSDERQRGAHPPAHTVYSDHHNRRYLKLVRKYADIIVGQFFGHLHSDTFRVIYSDTGRPISWAMLAPALTPKRTTDGANNPGLRIYKFDKDTGQILDYTQYYLDLSHANSNSKGDAEWAVEYSFSSYYGISDITPTSLHQLADKLTSASPNDYFNRYYRANSVRMYSSPQTTGCDANCAHTHYCAITRVDYQEFEHCLKTAASALASSSFPLLRAPLLVLLIATYFVICKV